jgi:hypothetical protein
MRGSGPIKFIKYHPWGFGLSAIAGMAFGPWALGVITSKTGFTLGIPKLSAGYSVNGTDETP